MRSPQHLRDELRFVTEFSTLLEIMQQVAVSQLRRLEEVTATMPGLAETLTREFFPLLPEAARSHPLVQGGTRGARIIMLTSDEGMVGPLHANVLRAAMAHADATTHWMTIGQRGLRLLGDQGGRVQFMPIPAEGEATFQMQRLSRAVLAQYARDPVREVWLVAPRFLSMTRQDVAVHRLLPLPFPPAPVAGSLRELVIEPSVDRVVGELALVWIEQRCIEAYWSARRAECAARALHVEFSRQQLAKQAKRVRHEFFKVLHERVDVLVRETCVVQHQVAQRASTRRVPTAMRAPGPSAVRLR